jgi:hypothetical protein
MAGSSLGKRIMDRADRLSADKMLIYLPYRLDRRVEFALGSQATTNQLTQRVPPSQTVLELIYWYVGGWQKTPLPLEYLKPRVKEIVLSYGATCKTAVRPRMPLMDYVATVVSAEKSGDLQ